MLAAPPRDDWKTKYLPSGIQAPQHSAGVPFHPTSNWWRPLPFAAISQMLEPLLSAKVKRNAAPSGDQRGHEAMPGKLTSLRGSLPSAFAAEMSLPEGYANRFPS